MFGWFKEIFVERFWLRRATRVARAYSPEQRDKVRLLEGAARARTSAAAALRSPGEIGPAFTLLREAFALSVSAVLVGRGEHDAERALEIREAWQKLGAITGSLPPGPDLAPLEPLFADNDALVADRLEPARALVLRPLLERALAWLDGQTELRSVRVIKLVRVLRVAGVVLALAGSVVGVVVWLRAPAAAPPPPPSPLRAPRSLSHPGR